MFSQDSFSHVFSQTVWLYTTQYPMAGHNKWAQIKRQKGANDAARSKTFGKLARRITVEAKLAQGDLEAVHLKSAIEKAKEANMPKENIERAVQKASHSTQEMSSIVYETYGPGGCAIIIQTLTDNRNRTAQEIKHLLSKNDLELAIPGSATWAFHQTYEGYTPHATVTLTPEDETLLVTILEQIDAHDDVEDVITNAL